MSQTVEPQNADYPVDPDFDPLDPDYLADPYPYYARFRKETPIFYGATVNRLCGSGLEAVSNAARAIMLGEAHVYVGGGAENRTLGMKRRHTSSMVRARASSSFSRASR